MKADQRYVEFAELERTHKSYLANNKSKRTTAKTLGMARATLTARLKNYEEQKDENALEFPEFPSPLIPFEKQIPQLIKKSELNFDAQGSRKWFPIKVNDKKPIGINWFGDPHLDDDGLDLKRLYAHVNLCNKPGVYGANIGDSSNNWSGRLVHKWADQSTNAREARDRIDWFMLRSGIKWLVFLIGNHDAWGDGSAILTEMAKRHGTKQLELHDWQAQFSLNFPNDCKIKVWAAHDFPGDSMWNPLHGAVRAARFSADTDLLVCGDKHNWAISQWELADKGTSPVMIRARGYKFNDEYARHIGKAEQSGGCSIFTIINPNAATKEGRIIPFVDVEAGVDYLQFLRGR